MAWAEVAQARYSRSVFLRIVVLNFVNRESELRTLEGWTRSPKFEFLVVFGRRRVGKTYLLKRLLERQDGLYFLCDRGGDRA